MSLGEMLVPFLPSPALCELASHYLAASVPIATHGDATRTRGHPPPWPGRLPVRVHPATIYTPLGIARSLKLVYTRVYSLRDRRHAALHGTALIDPPSISIRAAAWSVGHAKPSIPSRRHARADVVLEPDIDCLSCGVMVTLKQAWLTR